MKTRSTRVNNPDYHLIDDVAYLVPMCQFPLIDINSDYDFMVDLLQHLVDKNEELEKLDIISGYLNPPDELMDLLEEVKVKEATFIGAAPEVKPSPPNPLQGKQLLQRRIPEEPHSIFLLRGAKKIEEKCGFEQRANVSPPLRT